MLLYFREKRFEIGKYTRVTLFALRNVSVALIAFLLLSPVLLTTRRLTEKPVILVAQDLSESVALTADSAFIRGDYPKLFGQMLDELREEYELRFFGFGDKVSENPPMLFNNKQTGFDELFSTWMSRYDNANVGAVILATDGIYNTGSSPLYLSADFPFPVYSVALGDTNIRKDLIINRVNYNKVAYLGNRFPVEVVITANRCSGHKAALSLSRKGKVLFSKIVEINSDRFLENVPVELEADKAGIQHYHLSITPLDGESTLLNNTQDIYIEVIDGREKILILAGAPHPDVSALKQSIGKNVIYEVEEALVSGFNKPLDSYNLVILHQVPFRGRNDRPLLEAVEKRGIPVLYILGSSSDVAAFSFLKSGLFIKQTQSRWNEAVPYMGSDFALFKVSDDVQRVAAGFPALLAPFGSYTSSRAMSVLFYQKVGSLVTDYPLILFNTASEPKTGIITGEGIWRWRMNNYQQTGNQEAFDEIIGKIIQYLSVKSDRSRFRLTHPSTFPANRNIVFGAEVYNESYELINDPEIKMIITDSGGRTFPFVFNRSNHAYVLDAGNFPPGDYTYTAVAGSGKFSQKRSGAFSVVPVNLEAINLLADHALLNAMSARNGGRVIAPADILKIPDILKAREDIRPLVYSSRQFSDLLNLFWVFVLIVVLLGAEWFLRKRNGAY